MVMLQHHQSGEIADNSAIARAPIVWCDHKGNEYSLHQMETTHLINIVRLVVNEWAMRHDVEPVPIRNPQARLNLKDYHLDDYAGHARVFCEAILERLSSEELSAGYQIVWARVVAKIKEVLNLQCGLPASSKLFELLTSTKAN